MVRKTDPLSSHEAANRLETSGHANCQRDQVRTSVKRWPLSTSRELASLGRLDRHMVARRLPELEREGLVKRFGGSVGDLRWRCHGPG